MVALISVVVPTLNEESCVEKCLNALLDQTLPRKRFEIIVSDSSSQDSTVEIAKSLADKVLVCQKKSAGFGRMFGASKAQGDKLAFIDADTVASPTWLEGVDEALDKAIAVTGPIRSLEKDSLVNEAFYRWWSLQSRLSVYLNYPLFPGFNIGVRKKEFELVDGFAKDDITTEDIDLSLKLNKYGRIIFSQKMKVFTSNRRLKEVGILPYVLNGFNFVLFGRCWGWNDHRRDF